MDRILDAGSDMTASDASFEDLCFHRRRRGALPDLHDDPQPNRQPIGAWDLRRTDKTRQGQDTLLFDTIRKYLFGYLGARNLEETQKRLATQALKSGDCLYVARFSRQGLVISWTNVPSATFYLGIRESDPLTHLLDDVQWYLNTPAEQRRPDVLARLLGESEAPLPPRHG